MGEESECARRTVITVALPSLSGDGADTRIRMLESQVNELQAQLTEKSDDAEYSTGASAVQLRRRTKEPTEQPVDG